MSISSVLLRGFGNGTFTGSIPFVVTAGYNISTIIPPTIPVPTGAVANGVFGGGLTQSGAFGDGETASGSFGSGKTTRGKL